MIPETSPTTRTDHPAQAAGGRAFALALTVDVILVVLFVWIGQREHTTSAGFGHLLLVASPFLVGLVLSTLLTRGFWTWHRLWPHGVVVWLCTLTVGMALRVLLDLGGAPLPFILVAAGTLALFLLGRRGISAWLMRRAIRST